MSALEPVLHISTAKAWAGARAGGSYRAPSLVDEGFIHLSTPAQVVASAERHYAGREDLVLLVIDPGAVSAELRWERSPHSPDPFPHLYGPLDLDAVRRVVPFPAGPEGFALPVLG